MIWEAKQEECLCQKLISLNTDKITNLEPLVESKEVEIGKLQIELCNLEDRYTDCLQETTQLKEGERESLLLIHDPVCSFLEKKRD